MLNDYDNAKQILKKYNQEHLLAFYDELDDDKKQALIEQICSTNFRQIFDLYEASKHDENISQSDISPLDYNVKASLSEEEINFYKSVGNKAIRSNKCAALTLAGGQGTRLRI